MRADEEPGDDDPSLTSVGWVLTAYTRVAVAIGFSTQIAIVIDMNRECLACIPIYQLPVLMAGAVLSLIGITLGFVGASVRQMAWAEPIIYLVLGLSVFIVGLTSYYG